MYGGVGVQKSQQESVFFIRSVISFRKLEVIKFEAHISFVSFDLWICNHDIFVRIHESFFSLYMLLGLNNLIIKFFHRYRNKSRKITGLHVFSSSKYFNKEAIYGFLQSCCCCNIFTRRN